MNLIKSKILGLSVVLVLALLLNNGQTPQNPGKRPVKQNNAGFTLNNNSLNETIDEQINDRDEEGTSVLIKGDVCEKPAQRTLKNKCVRAHFSTAQVSITSKKKFTAHSQPANLKYSFLNAKRGGNLLCSFSGVKPEKNGAEFAYNRGKIIEIYQLKNNGIEQLFKINDPIDGEGGLVINGKLKGNVKFISGNGNSLLFGRNGKPEITYRDAIVIDSEGKKENLLVTYVNNEVSLTVSEKFLNSARYPLVVDPLVGPPVDLGDTDISTTHSSVIVSNGTNRFFLYSPEDEIMQLFDAVDPSFMTTSTDVSTLGDAKFDGSTGGGAVYYSSTNKYCLVGTDESSVFAILYDPVARTAGTTLIIADATNDGEIVGAAVAFDGNRLIAGWAEMYDVDKGDYTYNYVAVRTAVLAINGMSVTVAVNPNDATKKIITNKVIKTANTDTENGAGAEAHGPVTGAGYKNSAVFTFIQYAERSGAEYTKYTYNVIAAIHSAGNSISSKKAGKVSYSDRNADGFAENPRVAADPNGYGYFIAWNQVTKKDGVAGVSSIKSGIGKGRELINKSTSKSWALHQTGAVCFSGTTGKYMLMSADAEEADVIVNNLTTKVIKNWKLHATTFNKYGQKQGQIDITTASPSAPNAACGINEGLDNALIIYETDSVYAQLYKFSATGN